MLDDAAFLQVICADPDADGPRLVYADYLDEKGDPPGVARAEFIRVQCAMAAADPLDGLLETLGDREAVLLTDHWRDWLKPACQALAEPTPVATGRPLTDRYALNWSLPSPRRVPVHWVTQSTSASPPYLHSGQFRRGFLSHVALVSKPHKSANHVARLFERAPVDGLTFVGHPRGEIEKTLSSIDGSRLRALELVACPLDALRGVVTCRSLEHLRELVVMGAVGADIAVELGNSNSLPGLRTLILHACAVDSHGLERLCEAPFAPSLERLEFSACGLTNATVTVLARHFPEDSALRFLGLTHDFLTNESVRLLGARFAEACQFITPAGRDWPTRYYR